MISFFFKLIPHLLFFPIAICTFGGFFLTILFKKKRDDLFWIISFTLFFMIGWRLICQNVLFSSRYSSILFYPALIFTAYFCFRLRAFCAYITIRLHLLRKHPNCRRICLLLPYPLLLGLSIACIAKSFHFDPKFQGIINVCQAYREDRKGKDVVYTYYIYGSEQNRIRHYGQINDYREPIKLCKNEATYDQIMDAIRDKRNIEGVHYFFYLKTSKDSELLPPDDIIDGGEWREICRHDISSTKKNDFILYSYSPYCKNIELWEKDIPNMSPNNLCPNGDFEQIISEEDLKTRINYYKTIGASDFFTAPQKDFPKDWWINVLKAKDNNSPVMFLSAEHPIAGMYSLEIYGKGYWGDMTRDAISTNSAFVVKQDCLVSGFIRAKEDSEVWLYSRYWDTDKKTNTTIEQFHFSLSAGKTYKFSFPIQKTKVPDEDKWIHITIRAKGHILVDNVEIINIQEINTANKKLFPAAVPVVSPEDAEELNAEALILNGFRHINPCDKKDGKE